MAHLTKSTGDPITDAVQAYRQFYQSSVEQPYDEHINMADYTAWAYHHKRLTGEQQFEALRYYSRMWGSAGR